MESSNNLKVLLGCSGCKDCSEVPALIKSLLGMEIGKHNVEVKVVVTASVERYIPVQNLQELCEVHRDVDEWEQWNQMKVLHIELRRWADLFVIAPMNADVLGKVAIGLCDDLLTCVVRAWDCQKPLMFCPSMSTNMWEHPLTATHISKLKEYKYKEISCTSSNELGRMADVSVISHKISEVLSTLSPMRK